MLVSKVDADTNQNVAEGAGTLQGAQFTVKYYAGTYSSDPAAQGVAPTRKWVFATDADGFCYFSSAYLVSGDAFYTNSSGIPSLPLGTVTIQETKAPEGYLLNPEVYVRQILANGNAENVDTYNYPIIKENSLKLDLVKKQEGTEIVIPGVVFEHTTPNGVVSTYTTDNGSMSIRKPPIADKELFDVENKCFSEAKETAWIDPKLLYQSLSGFNDDIVKLDFLGENKGVMISSKEAKSIVLPKRKPNDTTAY